MSKGRDAWHAARAEALREAANRFERTDPFAFAVQDLRAMADSEKR